MREALPDRHARRQERVARRIIADAEPVEDDEGERHPAAAGCLQDGGELLRLERCAADQRAVDVGLGEQLGGVVGRHAAAVLDRNRVGGVGIGLAQDLPDLRGDLLGVRRRRRITGPDGPDRLIGDHETGAAQPIEPGDGRPQLAVDDRRRRAGPSLLRSLPDRGDRSQAVGHRADDLAPDPLIGLAVVLPALGVAEDDEIGEPGEHQRAGLAREGAALLEVHRLGSDGDAARSEVPRRSASQIVGGQMTVVTAGAASAASCTALRKLHAASSRVAGFIFQFPAITRSRISSPGRRPAPRAAEVGG